MTVRETNTLTCTYTQSHTDSHTHTHTQTHYVEGSNIFRKHAMSSWKWQRCPGSCDVVNGGGDIIMVMVQCGYD